MKSPFPGMDPFIEAFDLWGDFHDKLIDDLERELSERVPKRYVVRLNARSYITVDDRERDEFAMVPDVSVKRRKGRTAKRCHVWPAHTLQPLPRIPIPLENEDADIEIDLQPMADAIYERARYAVDIDYTDNGSMALSKGELDRISEALRRVGRKVDR